MAKIEDDRYYTDDHEWAMVDPDDDGVVIVGITDWALGKIGDIVMVELPELGDTVTKGDAFGSIESPKSVSDTFAPVGGEVVAINEELEDAPELVNDDCYGGGWIAKIRLEEASELSELMDAEAYGVFCAGLDD